MRTNVLLVVLLVASLGITVPLTGAEGQKVWTTSTFSDFREGTLVDGGVNSYVAADGTVRLINLWDYNDDGNFDLPVSCPQDYNESVPLGLYWATAKGYAQDQYLALPTDGAVAVDAADLNSDGYPDLLVANNFDGEKTNLNSFIYWNSKHGLDPSRKTLLPAIAARAIVAEDLNRDGDLDVVIVNRGNDYHQGTDRHRQSYIYWGSGGSYSAENRTSLETIYGIDVAVRDVNQDDYPDILFANEGNGTDDGGAMIYLGNAEGTFSEECRLVLPGNNSTSVIAEDLNADGFVDVVLTCRSVKKRDMSAPGTVKDAHVVPSYIYWGSPRGYSPQTRTVFPIWSSPMEPEGFRLSIGTRPMDLRPRAVRRFPHRSLPATARLPTLTTMAPWTWWWPFLHALGRGTASRWYFGTGRMAFSGPHRQNYPRWEPCGLPWRI